jgi:hypothetical protein
LIIEIFNAFFVNSCKINTQVRKDSVNVLTFEKYIPGRYTRSLRFGLDLYLVLADATFGQCGSRNRSRSVNDRHFPQ